MKFFNPIYVLKPTTPFSDKMGGRPQGFERARWPDCGNCQRPLSFIAQFIHHAERLDLGREGRVLYVFQCGHNPGICETWEHSSGANACIVLEPEELALPKGTEHSGPFKPLGTFQRLTGFGKVPRDLPPLQNEVFVGEWEAEQDGVPVLDYFRFFNDADYLELPTEMTQNLTWSTRLGGVPTWIQSADEYPKSGWRFLGQLSEVYDFYSGVKRAPKWVFADEKKQSGRTHYAAGPNFGGGIAYLFLESKAKARPNVKMFWQC